MKLSKVTIIDAPINYDSEGPGSLKSILTSKGFRNLHADGTGFSGERGSNWFTMLVPGDPRRWYHSVQVSENNIRYKINTWFGIFTNADKGVFLAEAEGIKRELNGESHDPLLLSQATKKRRISDAIILLVFVLALFFAFIILPG